MSAHENRADFAARAEERRQQGDALQAVEIAEAGLAASPDDLRARIVLALAHIDLGDVLLARDELAAALRPSTALAPPVVDAVAARETEALGGELEDDELETAFAEAESDPDEMMDANRVVEETLRAAELDAPEPDFDLRASPTYATASMAALLDGQGRREEADALRESLDARAGLGGGEAAGWVGPDLERRLRIVATLEGWLHNLRRNAESDARVRAASGAGGAV